MSHSHRKTKPTNWWGVFKVLLLLLLGASIDRVPMMTKPDIYLRSCP